MSPTEASSGLAGAYPRCALMASQKAGARPAAEMALMAASSPRDHSRMARVAMERAASRGSESAVRSVAAHMAKRSSPAVSLGSDVAASACLLSLLLKNAAWSETTCASSSGTPHSSAQDPSIVQVKGRASSLRSSTRSSTGSGAPPAR